MGLSKRDAFHDEILGQIRRRRKAALGFLNHLFPVEVQMPYHFRQDVQAGFDRINGIEKGLLILLEIPVVGHGKPLQQGQQSHKIAVYPARLSPDELCHVRVLFLGHNAAARRESIGNFHKMKFPGGPENEIFAETAQMHHDQRGVKKELRDKIPVGNRIHAVVGYFGKPQQAGDVGPVNGKRGACQGGSPKRHHIDPAMAVPQTRLVTVEHFPVSQEIMGKKDRLSLLQMRITGEDRFRLLPGEIKNDRLEGCHTIEDRHDFGPEIEPDIQCDLIVAASASMKLCPCLSRSPNQGFFNRHVNVFVFR
ncbi:MAG: hypothetical protein A4E70_00510 [Syntrophus sp. PtaU1.Bin005]|nr:MAG: hypothetical protein A4E70_00510 [Syntrophus sp. PtaU1.Bin005]